MVAVGFNPRSDVARRVPSRVALQLSAGEVARYYEGFSNRVLWPVLHSMPERVPFEGRHWGTYAGPRVWWRADPSMPARRFQHLASAEAPEVESVAEDSTTAVPVVEVS